MKEMRILLGFFAVVIVLLLLGFARIVTVTNGLTASQHTLRATQSVVKTEQARACALRKAGRKNTNAQERIPLRKALQYLGDLIVKGAAQQPDAKKRAQALRVGQRFQAYAAQVKQLSNPNC